MAELLFIATTVFVAYVVYTAIGGGNKDNPEEASQPAANPATTPEPAATTLAENPPPPPAPTPIAEKPVDKAPAVKPKATATAPKTKPLSAANDSVKNPKTGEVAKLTPNYAFAKRWIKEALVEEGLLDKIYKNNELDDDTNAKIQAALQALQALKKYQ